MSAATVPAYSPAKVCRQLNIPRQRLEAWVRHGLIPRRESYTFRELSTCRVLEGLSNSKLKPAEIKEICETVRDYFPDLGDPLHSIKIQKQGRRVIVQSDKTRIDVRSGQMLLNFERREPVELDAFRKKTERASRQHRQEAETWFQQGIEAEQRGATREEIFGAYQRALDFDANLAGAWVNLGTVYFRERNWKEAQKHYEMAIEVDPKYPLAHFNLANLFDERGDRRKAVLHYNAALMFNPAYADAHYNLALLYQNSGQVMKAIHHWRQCLQFERNGQWAAIARGELEKLYRARLVPGTRASAASIVRQAPLLAAGAEEREDSAADEYPR